MDKCIDSFELFELFEKKSEKEVIHRCIYVQMDRWIDVYMYICIDVQMYRWIDGYTKTDQQIRQIHTWNKIK